MFDGMTTETKHPKPADIIRPDPANPNRMDSETKAAMARSLAEFGDLAGIVLNRRTGMLVGGHQRADVLRDGELHVTDLPKPEPDGTIARGYLEHLGRRYAVRVVDWSEDKAHAALLAANRFGRLGQDDATLLKDLLEQLDSGQTTDTGQLLADLTGFDAAERERMALQVHGGEESGEGKEQKIKEQFVILVTCRDELHQTELLDKFLAEGIECKALQS